MKAEINRERGGKESGSNRERGGKRVFRHFGKYRHLADNHRGMSKHRGIYRRRQGKSKWSSILFMATHWHLFTEEAKRISVWWYPLPTTEAEIIQANEEENTSVEGQADEDPWINKEGGERDE